MAAERSVRAYSRMAMSEGAQFIRFCALQRMDAEVPTATQIGGSRATAAASDHYAVRAAFQSVSDLIDSERVRTAPNCMRPPP